MRLPAIMQMRSLGFSCDEWVCVCRGHQIALDWVDLVIVKDGQSGLAMSVIY
jgi:hypothetical protein